MTLSPFKRCFHAIYLTGVLYFPTAHAAVEGQATEVIEDDLGIEFVGKIEPKQKPVEKQGGYELRGFIDTRYGTRLEHTDYFDRQTSLAETRAQGDLRFKASDYEFNIKADLTYDDVIDGAYVDVREAYVELPANQYAQVRIGRQNIMWGLGDLLVANDVFPKDFMGLYYGRDAEAEYMVLSSDSVRASVFLPGSTLDLVFAKYRPWDIPTGERFSYFNPFLQQITGEKNVLDVKDNDKIAFMSRWGGNFSGKEVYLYFNYSYWQSPEGFDPQTQQLYYPRLNTYGFSIRNELGAGIFSLDTAYYDSVEDGHGDKFWIRNSETRFILAYDFELVKNLNLSFQWYQEQHRDHDEDVISQPAGFNALPKYYNLYTMRVNQMLMSQKMTLSLFIFHSTTQKDTYLRLNLFYKFNDHWMTNIGLNNFTGDEQGRLGQLKHNSNAFAAIRWSF